MSSVIKLLDIECVLFEFNNGSLVVVDITIIGCRKDGYDHWELLRTVPFMHFISIELSLVRSQDREELIFMKELVGCLLSKEIRTASYVVLLEALRAAALFVLDWI